MPAKSSRRRSGLALVAAIVAAACGVHTSSSGGVKVLSVSPNTATISGGPQITITGSNFTDPSGHANVSFGNGTVVGDVVNDTTIHVPLPGSLACGKVDVQVANTHGDGILFNGFDYTGGSALLSISGISPNSGDVAGGTPITITGSGFSGGVGLSIGGQLLSNVVVVDDHTLTAVTPPQSGGAVDLVARNCAHQVQVPNAFTFTSGLNGGLVIFTEYHYPNPAQFSNNPSDAVFPFAAFYQPSSAYPLASVPSSGTCVVVNDVYPNVTEIDGGPSVNWDAPTASGPMTLAQQTTASGTFFEYYEPDSTGLPANDSNLGSYAGNGHYTFTSAGSATLPAFTTTNAFIAQAGITFTAATNTLLFSTSPATVTKSAGMTLGWTAQAGAQVILIQMDAYDGASPTPNYLNSIRCIAPDNGSFKVPASALALIKSTAVQAVVNVDRRLVTPFLNGGNGSTITALTTHEQAGVVLLN